MLTRLIVASYAWLIEVSLWLTLMVAAVAGYHASVPILDSVGAVPASQFVWRLLGALAFLVVAFLVMAAAIGPIVMLMEIRQAVRRIEATLARYENQRPAPTERAEPSM